VIKKKPVTFGAFLYDKTLFDPYVAALKLHQTIGAEAVALGEFHADVFGFEFYVVTHAAVLADHTVFGERRAAMGTTCHLLKLG
jgi:O-acetyl-ADP-ribose deacetylase (regulator of RNase III)